MNQLYSEHEFHIVIVDNFPPPGLTWHESFCFFPARFTCMNIFLLRGSYSRLEVVKVIESRRKRKL